MLGAASFIMAKKQKQPKCLPSYEWINKTQCIHTMGYFSVTKGMKYWDFATTAVNPKLLVLSESSQT